MAAASVSATALPLTKQHRSSTHKSAKFLPLMATNPMQRQGRCCAAICTTSATAVSSAAVKSSLGSSKGGAGVLERPTFDRSQFEPSTPLVEEGGDIGRLKDRRGTGSGDSYRVLLIDDTRHTEKLVVKVLPQVVPSVTSDNARNLFHQSRENGVAVVIVTVKEHAEFYAQMMVRGGLRSTIEPDSNTV